MAQFNYKCVPVPTVLDTGKAGKDPHGAAVIAYQNIINESAKDGWELVQADQISSVQNPGCFAGLFGMKAEAMTFKLLIFKKAI
ncbi:MAG: DUF4177 domain-containing protein [Leptospirales bacterium]|nr:DUF4177 domain-containing protein [Leptospirales bacterium]